MVKLKSSESKYSKEKAKVDSLNSDFSDEENFDDQEVNSDFSDEENFDDQEVSDDFSSDQMSTDLPINKNHLRSRGLFQNIWWKKGLLKGFTAWGLIVVIFYIFDFLGLVEVISWMRWAFLLIIFLIFGIAYEKFLFKKIKF